MANNSQQPSGNQAANTTNQNSASDWSEHATDDGIRYYYNTTTRQSSWEKPLELMLRDEWDDASIVWKEFTSSDGKKYYYNTTTRQSSWEKPLEFMSPVEITVVTTPVYEDFNSAVLEEAACQTISKINLKKLLHEELVETLKVREEKKAKKRQRLADDFTNLLYSFKDITTTSVWEDCKPLFEETQEYKSVGDESYGREIFEEYITYLKGKN